ncbi:MAG: hypothetical protein WAJ82_11960 [Azonexus sp.]|jgi:hypothetical protein
MVTTSATSLFNITSSIFAATVIVTIVTIVTIATTGGHSGRRQVRNPPDRE